MTNAITTNPIATPIRTPQPLIPEPRTRANRANALLSTGPRTPDGKQRSSLNALRHGLTADFPRPTVARRLCFAYPGLRDISCAMLSRCWRNLQMNLLHGL